MKPASAKDIPELQSFMKDFWEMIKQTWNVSDGTNAQGEKEWAYIVDVVDQIDGQLKEESQKQCCRWLMLAYVDFLEERRKVHLQLKQKFDYAFEINTRELAERMHKEARN